MQAICENCGKTITPDDFRHGRYFLFWVTPTIPAGSLYLCDDCRGLSWDERERLFDRWMERCETRPAKQRNPRKRAKAARRQSPRPASKRPKQEPASLWDDPELRSKELKHLAQKAFELSR